MSPYKVYFRITGVGVTKDEGLVERIEEAFSFRPTMQYPRITLNKEKEQINISYFVNGSYIENMTEQIEFNQMNKLIYAVMLYYFETESKIMKIQH